MKHDKGVTYPKSARSLDLWMENITRLHAESRHRNYTVQQVTCILQRVYAMKSQTSSCSLKKVP
jgi:hypothetical protein